MDLSRLSSIKGPGERGVARELGMDEAVLNRLADGVRKDLG